MDLHRRHLLTGVAFGALSSELEAAAEDAASIHESLYIPKVQLVDDRKFLHDFMEEFAFVDLITATPTLRITHIPCYMDRTRGEFGTIFGHISKNNPQNLTFDGEHAAVIVFRGPHGYISPSWYATKEETGKVVPTWNYSVVHAYGKIRVIEALDGQLITNELLYSPKKDKDCAIADPSRDLLKITVVNRYSDTPPSVSFIKNIGLKRGAIASSVAHDSHNIIAVGVDDKSICQVVNLIIAAKGGIAAAYDDHEMIVPLPVAGIMSAEDGYEVSKRYKAIDRMANQMGSPLGAPFMTLSFMALLVIPSLKISDQGLFNGSRFQFVTVSSE